LPIVKSSGTSWKKPHPHHYHTATPVHPESRLIGYARREKVNQQIWEWRIN
jgi:hypothetical protein